MSTEIDLGIDHLTDVKMIGQGGFSVVYAASHTLFKRRMAVKLLNPLTKESERLRFERECEVLGRLSDHPNVVSVFNAGYSSSDRPYLLMELVEGGTLQHELEKRGSLPWRDAVSYLLPICDALGRAHTEKILHRDVKPENILLTEDGKPRLADFGIASLRDATGATSTHITASMLHTAPETFENLRDERSDLYSLASTMYHLIVGGAPFWQNTDQSIHPLMNRLLNEPAPPLPAHLAPAELSEFVQRALAKDPNQRPQTATGFAAELQAILDGHGAGPEPVEPEAVDPNQTVLSNSFAPEPLTSSQRVAREQAPAQQPPAQQPAAQQFPVAQPQPFAGQPGVDSGPVGPPPGSFTGPEEARPSPPQSWAPTPAHWDSGPIDDRGPGFNSGPAGMVPGWYHATGDPADTRRYWNGYQWQGNPEPAGSHGANPGVAGLRFAGAERRMLARLIDYVLWFAIWIFWLLLVVPTGDDESASYLQMLGLGLWTTATIAAYEILAVTAFGATLGKMIFAMKVVNEDGSKVGFSGAAMRMVLFIVLSVASTVVYFPFLIMLVIAGVAIGNLYSNDRRQTLWDKQAKTVVVSR